MADESAPPTGPDDPLAKLMLGVQNAASDSGGPDAAGPAPAPAPAPPPGPPRLRGQARVPPPPQPGAPPEDLSLPAVLQGAGQNFTRSAAGNIANTAEFLNPMNWGRDAAGIGALGQGVLSKAGLIDQGDPKAQAAHQAPINAVENMNWEHYGTIDNLLRTLKNDPTTPLSDLAAVASIPLGGEGLVAKIPGVAGDVLRAGMTGAKVAQLGDPTYAALKAAGAGAKVVGAGAKLASKIPGAGLIGEGVGTVAGAGLGHAISHAVPLPGAEIFGGILGDRIAKGAMSMAGKGLPGPVKAVASDMVNAAPRIGAVARTQPMSPEEQQAAGALKQAYGEPGSPGAPPASPAGPAAPVDPDEAQAEAMARGFGLIPASTTPTPVPSSGLQGAPPAPTTSGPTAVIRQAEGGFNQPVGYQPKQGSARGAYQMIDSTYAAQLRKYLPQAANWSDAQIKAFRNTPQGWALNETLGEQLVNHEAQQLQAEGIDPNADNVGVFHMLGNTHLLHADPNTPIEQVTGAAQRAANPGAFRNVRTAGDFIAWMQRRNQSAMAHMDRPPQGSAYAADGGRVGFAEGGQVIDMTEQLLKRAEQAKKAAQASTKPLLGLSDNTVAQALRVAQRGI